MGAVFMHEEVAQPINESRRRESPPLAPWSSLLAGRERQDSLISGPAARSLREENKIAPPG
jgi:hypothetical protein